MNIYKTLLSFVLILGTSNICHARSIKGKKNRDAKKTKKAARKQRDYERKYGKKHTAYGGDLRKLYRFVKSPNEDRHVPRAQP